MTTAVIHVIHHRAMPRSRTRAAAALALLCLAVVAATGGLLAGYAIGRDGMSVCPAPAANTSRKSNSWMRTV